MANPIRTLGPGSLKLGETASPKEWGGELTKAAVTVSTSSDDDLDLLNGSTMAGEDTHTYALDATCVDNFTMDSLQVWAFQNAGKEVPFSWVPSTVAGGITISGTVKVAPIGFGGDVKKKNTQDFTLRIIGTPQIKATA